VGARILWISALIFGLYLVIGNGILRTRILRDGLSRQPEARLVDYETAYSIIPGRVHLEGLSLSDLLRRRFHATSVRASGVSLRARLRIDPADSSPEVLAALPPIPGFVDPPAADIGPERLPLTDAEYDLWSVDLEDVSVDHVREVWVHTLRGQGDSHVHGRWLFQPQRWLEMGPTLALCTHSRGPAALYARSRP
jgi:hypothetical protein